MLPLRITGSRPCGESGAINLQGVSGQVWACGGFTYFRTSKLWYFPRYPSPRRYALRSLSGEPAWNFDPTSRSTAGLVLNMGSRTRRFIAPFLRTSRPTMVKECPRYSSQSHKVAKATSERAYQDAGNILALARSDRPFAGGR